MEVFLAYMKHKAWFYRIYPELPRSACWTFEEFRNMKRL